MNVTRHQAAIGNIEAEFDKQGQEYELHSKTHYKNVVRLCEESRMDALKSAVAALASGAAAACSLVALRLAWVSCRPEHLARVVFGQNWYRPSKVVARSGDVLWVKMTKAAGGPKRHVLWLLRQLMRTSAGALLAARVRNCHLVVALVCSEKQGEWRRGTGRVACESRDGATPGHVARHLRS